MPSTVVGLFESRTEAKQAIQDLITAGIDHKDIGLIVGDSEGKLANAPVDEEGNFAEDGAITGATSGAILGGLVGILVGAGVLAVPTLGLIAIGPMAGLFTGTAIGAVSGGVLGALIGLGIPNEHAEIYAEGVRRGGLLVTVLAAEGIDTDRIETILDRAGAADVDERAEAYRVQGFENVQRPEPASATVPGESDFGRNASSQGAYADYPTFNEKKEIPEGDIR